MSGEPAPATRPVARGPMLGFVALALVLAGSFAVAAGSRSTNRAASVSATPAAATMPPADARSSAWFCTTGTASRGGSADETVVVANVGERSVHADVEVMTDASAPVVRRLDVAARTQGRLRVGDVVATPDPGVVVETFGAAAVVEHEIRNGDQVALGPCTRRSSSTWFLPVGTTAKGAQQNLSLFDPYGDDAIVDVTFLTDGGPLSPQEFQGLVVPRHSKVSVAVQDSVRRRNIVATTVQARAGRVVAEQSLRFDGTGGRSGLTLALGAPEPATDWNLPAGSFARGPDTMTIVNPGNGSASVNIDVVLDGPANLSPQTVVVPDHSVTNVDLLSRVPAGISFWVRLHSDQPVVAGQLTNGLGGATTVVAAPVGAPRWYFAAARVTNVSLDSIVVANPTSGPASVRVEVVRGGSVAPLGGAGNLSLPAGARTVVDLRAQRVPLDAAIVVTADADVVAERVNLAAPAISATMGVPDLGGTPAAR